MWTHGRISGGWVPFKLNSPTRFLNDFLNIVTLFTKNGYNEIELRGLSLPVMFLFRPLHLKFINQKHNFTAIRNRVKGSICSGKKGILKSEKKEKKAWSKWCIWIWRWIKISRIRDLKSWNWNYFPENRKKLELRLETILILIHDSQDLRLSFEYESIHKQPSRNICMYIVYSIYICIMYI